MTFKSVFIAVFLGTAAIAAAWILNSARPAAQTEQPSAQLVKAVGKCAECHRQETSAIIHQFERSRHAAAGINCLDCHGAAEANQRIRP